MATRRIRYEIEPMTLGNMRELGVRSLDVSCWNCQHRAVLSADRWPDDVAVPTFGPRMVCTGCGIVGADARPSWQEQPPRESLTGAQWRTTENGRRLMCLLAIPMDALRQYYWPTASRSICCRAW